MWKWTQKDENRPAPMGSPVPPVRVIQPRNLCRRRFWGCNRSRVPTPMSHVSGSRS
jgi:hypothetical protein